MAAHDWQQASICVQQVKQLVYCFDNIDTAVGVDMTTQLGLYLDFQAPQVLYLNAKVRRPAMAVAGRVGSGDLCGRPCPS